MNGSAMGACPTNDDAAIRKMAYASEIVMKASEPQETVYGLTCEILDLTESVLNQANSLRSAVKGTANNTPVSTNSTPEYCILNNMAEQRKKLRNIRDIMEEILMCL